MSDNYDCNGWKGHGNRASAYATWRVNLEICDDTINDYVTEGIQFPNTYLLVKNLEDAVDNVITNYDELEGIAVDYARAFVDDVNFYEIAESAIADHPQLMDDYEDDEDQDEDDADTDEEHE